MKNIGKHFFCVGASLLALNVAHAANPQAFGYYTNWSTYGRSFQPEDISKTGALDHLTAGLYAFAQIGNCAAPYATDDNPTLCNTGNLAKGVQDYRLYSTDPYADFKKIPDDYFHAGEPGKGNAGKFISTFHTQKKSALLSIGGYSLSVPFSVAIDSAHQQAFIQSIVRFLNQVKQDNAGDGFDGVDIDWEPNDNAWSFLDQADAAQTLSDYLSFMQNLKTALHDQYASWAWLTGAFPANTLIIDKAEAVHPGFWKTLAGTMDYMDIMAYDYHGAFDSPRITNLNAPLYYDPAQPGSVVNRDVFNVNSTIQTYAKYVPTSKLLLGIGLYGRAVNGVSDTNKGLYQTFSGVPDGEFDSSGVYDYKFVIGSMLGRGFTDYAISSTGQRVGTAAYCSQNCPVKPGVTTGTNTFISYDNVDDAKAKAAFARANGLAGVMFWSLDGDIAPNDPSNASLVKAATSN